MNAAPLTPAEIVRRRCALWAQAIRTDAGRGQGLNTFRRACNDMSRRAPIGERGGVVRELARQAFAVCGGWSVALEIERAVLDVFPEENEIAE
jgi:hypothetical protein